MNKSAPRYARVYIQLKTRSLEHTFDYLIPASFNGSPAEGSLVLVPFGRQKVLGVVGALDRHSEVPEGKMMSIERVLDYPSIPGPLIKLALWISHYYYCSVAAALSLVLPPGGLPSLETTIIDGKRSYALKEPRVGPRQVQFVRLADWSDGIRRTAARQKIFDVLNEKGELPVAEAARLAGTGRSTVRRLADLGAVEICTREVRRDGLRYYGAEMSGGSPAGEPTTAAVSPAAEPTTAAVSPAGETQPEQKHRLNKPQKRALEAIVGRLRSAGTAERSRPLLIEGVPGAGKTEVYLRAIEEAVARGGGAIVLVPEISLTYQAVKRIRRRFGERVGVYHSGLALGERYDEYMRIRTGKADVVIGPRSALFAPVSNLSLIVVDEENDSSFKQENEPRYDARRVALQRARQEGAIVVYGSATPSMESYHLVEDRFRIPERATGAPMPSVEIVDMRKERDHLFSQKLLEEIDGNRAAGGKTILMLNSRGYARYLQCAACGHVWKCDNCEVSLTIHNRIGRLLCHHCGFSLDMPDICPECNSSELRRWGVGTERLEREIKRLFPEADVFRLDGDTSRGYGEGPRIIEEFGRTQGAILVGTQMVAKGHHFPEVTLAAVMNADLALEFPEFRAEERTFSLLMQLAGRSGRAELPGKVLMQTWNGDIECIRMAADQSLEKFYAAELKRRQRLSYPPYINLINVICLSRESGKADEAAAFLKEKLGPVLSGEAVLGPAALFRLKGWFRSHILIKAAGVEATLERIKPVIEHYREPYRHRGVRIVVDVDPQWLS